MAIFSLHSLRPPGRAMPKMQARKIHSGGRQAGIQKRAVLSVPSVVKNKEAKMITNMVYDILRHIILSILTLPICHILRLGK